MNGPYIIARKYETNGAFFPLCYSPDENEAIALCEEINAKIVSGKAVVLRVPNVGSFRFGIYQLETVWP